MSSFIVDLWESIFTPGPTPTILKATNASFAALQVTLFALLVATHSVHFAILSVLSGGLWWAINWFAAELAAAQKAQRKEEDKDDNENADKRDSSSDTEVESTARQQTRALRQRGAAAAAVDGKALGSQSSVSTEDEWEKVPGNEKDKHT